MRLVCRWGVRGPITIEERERGRGRARIKDPSNDVLKVVLYFPVIVNPNPSSLPCPPYSRGTPMIGINCL